jgi:hypothetical protein
VHDLEAQLLTAQSVYLVFLFWDAFAVVVIYFAMVETKGLSLERMLNALLSQKPNTHLNTEIEEVFEQPNPRKYSVELREKLKREQSVSTA